MGFFDIFKKKKSEDAPNYEDRFDRQVENNLKGKEFEKNGEIEAAKELYLENVNEYSIAPHAYMRLAIIYRKEKNFDREIEVLERLIYVTEQIVNEEYDNAAKKLNKYKERLGRATLLRDKSTTFKEV